jgi:hypothetical protein
VRRNRLNLFFFCCLAALTLVGCQEEQIRHYRVPKVDTSHRMLAALFPHQERTWFFKLVGPAQAVTEHKEEFEHFMSSIRFANEKQRPITWTVPEGWKEEPGSEMRFATLRMTKSETPLEISVFSFGRESGSVLANVNRWRGQIGLGPISEAELAQTAKELKVDGVSGTLVDVTGPHEPRTMRTGPFASGQNPVAETTETQESLQYTTPAGWVKYDAPGPIRPEVALRVTEGNQSVEITVTRAGGGLLDNVNRWRNQIKLGPVSQVELEKDVRTIKVNGLPAQYVDLAGPGSGQRIVGVIVPQGEQSWFFKMRGPGDVVGKQKSAFEAFVGSVRFNGGRGASDG